jgi:uncharacterized membrane protein YbhN (UPF0104 family)
MTRVSSVAYALNKVVKTGGVGGMALFVRHGRTRERSAGQVVAAYVAAAFASQVALLAVIGMAIGSMILSGSVTGRWLAAAAAFGAVTLCGLTAVAVGARRRGLVHRVFVLPHRVHAGAARRLGRPIRPRPDTRHADRFVDAIQAVEQRPGAALMTLAHAVAAKLLGAGILAASIAATGSRVGYGRALTIYALALIASTVSMLPGGIGAVEASMSVLLIASGVAAPTAIAAVLTFRLLDLWFPLLVGLVAARGLRSNDSARAESTDRLSTNGLSLVAPNHTPIIDSDAERRWTTTPELFVA